MASSWLPVDQKYMLLGALGVTSSIAVYSTFKLSRERKRVKQDNVYESQKLLNEYLVFHYGSPNAVLKYEFGPKDSLDFPKRCADLCLKHFKGGDSVPSRAFDIGCSVGRSSFELTRQFGEVIGLDYSQAFVDACNDLKKNGQVSYFIQDEGDLVTHLKAEVSDNCIDCIWERVKYTAERGDEGVEIHGITHLTAIYADDVAELSERRMLHDFKDRSRASFMQGDACDLPKNVGKFGCILAANLICRLHKPYNFLNRLAGLVAPNGVLVITSPYTWLEQFTEKSTWLGGYQLEDGKEVRGFDTLKRVLGPDFDLLEDVEMPFFIRETGHKNQWTVAHATVWRRK